ncbi:MAG: BrnA antitoxin family protein [Thermomicrobiales bacterium]
MATSSSESSRSVLQPAMNDHDIERLLDDYADILENLANNAIADEDIDLSDHPEWTDEMFRKATNGTFSRPREGEAMVPLDTDTIAWFRQHYPNYQHAMNAALRAFMAAHEQDDPEAEPDTRKTA